MPELKGTQTHKNLKDAFAGESMAATSATRPTARRDTRTATWTT